MKVAKKGKVDQKPPFVVKDGKLFGRGKTGSLVELGPELKVIAFAEVDGDDTQNFALVKLRNYDDQIVYKYIARRDLLNRESTCKALTEAKYALPANADKRKALAHYIGSARPKGRRLLVQTVGWHRDLFALTTEVIGQTTRSNPKIVYVRPEIVEETKFGKHGTLAGWKTEVAAPAAESPVMVLGICAALAAPLVGLCGLEGGGWHLVGPSSSGKTITLVVARSVSGEATRGDLVTWRITTNAVEAVAFAYNHTLVCMDDTDQLAGSVKARANAMREFAHQLANGSGKRRLTASSKGIASVPTMKWKTLLLSNGVQNLADIVRGGGDERLPSEQVRFCDLPAVVGGTTGVFSKLPSGCATLDAALHKIETACQSNYGTALRAFVAKVVKDQNQAKPRVADLMKRFEKLALVSSEDEWEIRFAKKFGVAYAAGILGIEYGVLPWTQKALQGAILKCYRRARMAIPDADRMTSWAETKLRTFTKDSEKVICLYKLSKAERATLKPGKDMGFLERDDANGLHLVVRKEVFRQWFSSEREVQLLLQKLAREQRLIRTNARVPTCQRMYPWEKRRRRYYMIRARKPKKA